MSVQQCTRFTIRALAAAGVLFAVAACSDDPERDDSGAFTESGDADVFNIAVGDCMNDTGTGEVSEVPVVPCDQPHDSEVYHAFDVAGDTFPGTFQANVDEQCVPQFQTFIGLPADQSALEITWLEPTVQSWADGDREILCMVLDPAGQTTGSLAGAAR